MNGLRLRILLIEDDKDDYMLVQDLLSQIPSLKYNLEWVTTYEGALKAMDRSLHDVYLLDYRLGERNGLDLLQEMTGNGCRAPVIVLTGQGDYKIDIAAMKYGAADYLVKGQINAHVLERSIRYALERKRSEQALRESEKQLKFLSSRLLSVQESERKRIAAELHDNIGQVLTAIKFGVEHTVDQMQAGTATPDSLRRVIPLLQNTIEEVRRIYTHLRPSLLDDFGIVATVGWYCREFQKHFTEICIDSRIDVREEDISDNLKVVAYRILQEALENVARHSEANFVRLSLTRVSDRVELLIKDNGLGFDIKDALSARDPARGLGLASMKERAELSGGVLTIESARGSGTIVRASWPCS